MGNIAVIFGGPTPEHDISILTGLQAARELRAAHALYWSKAGDWYVVPSAGEGSDFLEGLPPNARKVRFIAEPSGGFVTEKKGLFGKSEPLSIDAAVVCCHGGPGEDGSLQGALDMAGIPYTGPNVAAAVLGMDKLVFTATVAAAGLPVLPRAPLTQNITEAGFDGPYIVKPRFGGSSIGVEVVDNLETATGLLRSSPYLRAGAVIEPYKPESYDLNVAVRMFPEVQLSAIEKPVRSTGKSSEILGYADKYVGGEGMVSAPRELPADIPSTTAESIRKMAIVVAERCDVRGIARIDFLADGVDLYVNEINTIPGSLSKHLFINPAIPFRTLLDDMVREATERPSRYWTAAGADGTALRSAGSIAGKLS